MRLRSLAPPALALLALTSLAAPPTTGCGPGQCVCDIAGLVELELGAVHRTPDAAYVQTHAQWRACCGELQEAARTFRIDAADGNSRHVDGALPPGAELVIDDRTGPLTLAGFTTGTELVLERHIHTLLRPEPLALGTWYDPARGETAAVRIDLFGSSDQPLPAE